MFTWYFSETEGRVICPEHSVQLTPKAAAVLGCLMRHAGDVVTVDTFLNEVWPDVHVTADLVREYISDLRAALNDDARQPTYIETVRGKGFRLKGGIAVATPDLTAGRAPRQAEIRPTVAVLTPVAHGNASIKLFADGIASDIINHLARFHDIGVVARHSSFSAEEVTDLRAFARDVAADYVLESSIGVYGPSVRVRFQLVDAETGRSLWAERFDHAADDLLAASDEMAEAVVAALTGWHGELHRAEFKTVTRKRATDLNAFEHFILGCDLELRFDESNLRRTLYHLEQSVALDPTFSRAWLVLALQLQWAFDVMTGRDQTYLQRSARAFETAFTLAPRDPVTLAIVCLKFAREGNLEHALGLLHAAEATMHGDADAMACVATAKAVLTDDIAGARALLDDAAKANPTRPTWFHFVEARITFFAGDYERCIICSRAGPPQVSALIFRCLSHVMLGQAEAALMAHAAFRTAYPDTEFDQFADYFPIAAPARRADYDAAVARLTSLLHETETAWPRLSGSAG
ncbi:MAG: winged helix-turn-helix domain-containing protein [Pseudomonadota bacterium]